MKKIILILAVCLITSPAFAFGDGGLEGPLGPVGQPTRPIPTISCHPVFVPGQGFRQVCD